MSLDRPVLVTGTPRTGKSVVRRIIAGGEEFHGVEEPLLIWNYGMGKQPDDRRTEADATPAVRRRIRADCQRIVQRAGKDRYLDDLAYHALRIPFVRAVMPEARIVLVIRSAEEAIPQMLYGWTYRDTLARAITHRRRNIRWQSLPRALVRYAQNYVAARVRGRRSTWGPTPTGLEEFAREHEVALVAAFQWRAIIETALEDLESCPPENWLEVRFDRLIADPRPELERIVAFCEPKDPQAVIDRAMAMLDPTHRFKNPVHPTEAQWDRIWEHIGPLQHRLGYPRTTPAAQPAEATA